MEKLYIYRAMYDFTPSIGSTSINIQQDDELEVRETDISNGVDYKSPQVWINAFNRRHQESGLVPGNFLQFVDCSMRLRHAFREVYFMKPAMCKLCQDYIWGSSSTSGMKCEGCSTYYHPKCSEMMDNNNSECPGDIESQDVSDVQALASPMPLSDWSTLNVIEWMATVNMYRYIEVFKRKQIDGTTLGTLTEDRLQEFGIKDEFHRKALMVCVNELCGREQEEQDALDESEECISEPTEHELLEHSFSSLRRCHKCNKYLHGIIRQGMQCQVCGLRLHKQCSVGKVPACGNDRLQHRRRPSFTPEPMFGIDLESQFAANKQGAAPDLLIMCTEEIERQSRENKIGWYVAYRSPSSSEATSKLKRLFDESADPYSINVSGYEPQVLGGVVKKYLRELADPLIPVLYYNKFIAAAKQSDPEKRNKAIVSLVNELPEHHNSSLKFMMSHFCRILKPCSHEDSVKLAQVFCHILLRPDWGDIIQLVHNTEFHMRIFDDLFISQDKEIQPELNGYVAPSRPPPVAVPPSPQAALEQCEWFWGDISKEEVHERLNGTCDGTYLVRRATTHSRCGDYTLTLRKGGTNRLIKIYHRNERYGFSEPYEFKSVQDLVEHFKTHSLAEYNSHLNCTLDHPLVNQPQSYEAEDGNSLYRELARTHRKYVDKSKEFDKLIELQSKTTHNIQILYQAHDSFEELVKVFEEQMELHKQNSANIAAHEYSKIQQNSTVLESRLRKITESKNNLEESIKEKAAANRSLIVQINSKKPEIKALGKQRDQLRNTLITKKGYSKQAIDEFLDSNNEERELDTGTHSDYMLHDQVGASSIHGGIVDTTRVIKHSDKSTWYRENLSRQSAERDLASKPEGTFLIRSKPNNEYALSIINEKGQPVHCIISSGPDGFGFADPFMVHENLVDLVLHYKNTSLEEHNTSLNVKLTHPAYTNS